jgi:heptosyltransferase-2
VSAPSLPDPDQVRRILVRSTNWIGDVVMISPALDAIRRRYSRARIEVVAIPQVAECLEGNRSVDEVIRFDRRGRDCGARGLLRLAGELRRRGYEMAFLFQKAMGAALMARLARVPVRIGLAADRRAWLLTHPIRIGPELAGRHNMLQFLEVARAAGCDTSGLKLGFPLGQEEKAWAGALLDSENASRFPFLIGLHVGASKRPRAWHLERFIETARRLSERYRAGILLLGGPAEVDDMKSVAGALDGIALNTCGRTTIRQMAALIARCRLLVGNDSGPMHLASAFGVPVVAVFGPGDPSRTAPMSPSSEPLPVAAVSRRYPCAPCRQAFFRECYPSPSGKPMCLESVSVEEVVEAAARLIDPTGG